MLPDQFLSRWSASGDAERANKDSSSSSCATCSASNGPHPKTGDPAQDLYVFEKDVAPVPGPAAPIGRVDLYKEGQLPPRGEAGRRDRPQAARFPGLEPGDERGVRPGPRLRRASSSAAAVPPVCDIGYCFDVYASFDGTGVYRAFPDGHRKRFFLRDLDAHTDLLRRSGPIRSPRSREAHGRRHAGDRRADRGAGARPRSRRPRARDRGHVPDALPFHHVRRGRGAAAGRAASPICSKAAGAEPAIVPRRRRAALGGDGPAADFVLRDKILRFNGGLFVDARRAGPLTDGPIRTAHRCREERLARCRARRSSAPCSSAP